MQDPVTLPTNRISVVFLTNSLPLLRWSACVAEVPSHTLYTCTWPWLRLSTRKAEILLENITTFSNISISGRYWIFLSTLSRKWRLLSIILSLRLPRYIILVSIPISRHCKINSKQCHSTYIPTFGLSPASGPSFFDTSILPSSTISILEAPSGPLFGLGA